MAWILLRCRPSWRHRSGYGLASPATLSIAPGGPSSPGALSPAGGRVSPSAVWRFAIGQDLPAGAAKTLSEEDARRFVWGPWEFNTGASAQVTGNCPVSGKSALSRLNRPIRARVSIKTARCG